MSETIETEAETTNEAIEAALAELGVGRNQVEVEILEEPNKGLLGLRRARARVKVTVLGVDEVATAITRELLEKIGAEATIETHQEDDGLWIVLRGDSPARLIGRRGHTLDSLQTLVQAMVGHKIKAPARVSIDIEGYRARRKREVRALAERTVGKVLARQDAISLRPMNAYERKQVHLVVSRYEGVVSLSTGVDPDRFIIISPAETL